MHKFSNVIKLIVIRFTFLLRLERGDDPVRLPTHTFYDKFLPQIYHYAVYILTNKLFNSQTISFFLTLMRFGMIFTSKQILMNFYLLWLAALGHCSSRFIIISTPDI